MQERSLRHNQKTIQGRELSAASPGGWAAAGGNRQPPWIPKPCTGAIDRDQAAVRQFRLDWPGDEPQQLLVLLEQLEARQQEVSEQCLHDYDKNVHKRQMRGERRHRRRQELIIEWENAQTMKICNKNLNGNFYEMTPKSFNWFIFEIIFI